MMLQTWLERDARLTRALQLTDTHGLAWHMAALLARSGDSWLWAIGMAVLWLFAAPAWHFRAAVLGISVVIQALFVFALKQFIRRKRPVGDWGGIYRQYDPHSFPSGHATRAALLVVLSASLGPAWLANLLLGWAPLVCLARVMTGVHYLSDILGGLILGALMGLLLLAAVPLGVNGFPFLFFPLP